MLALVTWHWNHSSVTMLFGAVRVGGRPKETYRLLVQTPSYCIGNRYYHYHHLLRPVFSATSTNIKVFIRNVRSTWLVYKHIFL